MKDYIQKVPRGTARRLRRENMDHWKKAHPVPRGNPMTTTVIGKALRVAGPRGRMFYVKGRFLNAGLLFRSHKSWSESKEPNKQAN